MKRRNIFQSAMAAGLALSSVVISTLMLGSSAALADDDFYNRSSGISSAEWNELCKYNSNPAYCAQLRRNGELRGEDSQNRDWRIDNNQNDDWRDRYGNNRNRDWRIEDNRNNDWRDRYGNNRSYDLRLFQGTSIPTRVSRQGHIVLRRGEQYALRLITDRDLVSDRSDRVVIPRGSSIYGVLVPYRNGYRFESQYVTLRNGGQRDLWAVSDVIDSGNRYNRSENDSVLSPAASIILGTLIGRSITPDSNQIGDIFDRDSRARRDLVVVYPNRDLDLRLSRDFVLRYR
jgi:hypothetical protein